MRHAPHLLGSSPTAQLNMFVACVRRLYEEEMAKKKAEFAEKERQARVDEVRKPTLSRFPLSISRSLSTRFSNSF